MKRIIALIMAVLMMATLFVGCAKDQAKTEDKAKDSAKKDSATSDSATKTEPTLKELDKIKEAGVLKIGYTEYTPMNYKNDEGKLVGFDTEYAELVCAELGVTPEFILIDWKLKEVDLESGKIDCIWNGFTISDEREENLDFTAPYLNNKQVAVCRKADAEKFADINNLKTAKLTAEKGSAGETVIVETEEFANATYVESNLQTAAITAVKAMRADACIVDYTVAKAMAGNGDFADLVMITDYYLVDEYYGIGFRTGSDITAEVNRITAELVSNGTFEALAQKYNLQNNLIK